MTLRRFRVDFWGQAPTLWRGQAPTLWRGQTPPCGGDRPHPVVGTGPTNALSKFTSKIEMKAGAPVVTVEMT